MLRVLFLYILILDIGQSILIVECSMNFTSIFWSMNKTIIESGFGRVLTLGSNDPIILEGVESQCDIYESGFGEVLTLVSNDSTISEEVPIDYEIKVAIYDFYCDDMYAIREYVNHETCHHPFNFQLDCASHDSYFVEFAPTIPNEKNFAYVEISKISMLVDHEKNALCDGYIFEFIHDATEKREEYMPVGVAIISSFLSMCLKF